MRRPSHLTSCPGCIFTNSTCHGYPSTFLGQCYTQSWSTGIYISTVRNPAVPFRSRFYNLEWPYVLLILYLRIPDHFILSSVWSSSIDVMSAYSKRLQLLAVVVAVVVHLEIVTGQTNVCTTPPQIPDAARKLQHLRLPMHCNPSCFMLATRA